MDMVRVSEYVGFVGFLLWASVERGFGLLSQQQAEGQAQDQGSFRLISVCWYGATLFALLDAWTLGWTTFRSPLWALRAIGAILIVGGLAMRIIARRALGKQYSVRVETSDAHQLVTEGVYRVLRHPAYLGLVGLLLGIPLCEGSWGGLALAVAAGMPAIIYRIQVEERSLSRWFGQDYEQYKKGTWRLIPHLW